MRRTSRSFRLRVVYWPGVEPFNRAWLIRTLLEGAYVGPIWLAGEALVPGIIGQLAALTLAGAGATGVVLVLLWSLALLCSRCPVPVSTRNSG